MIEKRYKDIHVIIDVLQGKEDEELSILAKRIVSFLCKKDFGLTDLEIEVDKNGKKRIVNHPNIDFSISHTFGCVVVAVRENGKIGIDTEKVHKISEKVINRFFSENEKRKISNSVNSEFVETLIWTKKEAYIKCVGEGISKKNLTTDTEIIGRVVHGEEHLCKGKVPSFAYWSMLVESYIVTICFEDNV
ncbi:MAG: 4'-phosphopantetheinyl transferase superfamily protein [Eubacterium sp.]|nr:4'-phosphopantetheinyl transferase superfamily protein [Eubacterium sp.]